MLCEQHCAAGQPILSKLCHGVVDSSGAVNGFTTEYTGGAEKTNVVMNGVDLRQMDIAVRS
jgi:hypothetical protein